MKNAEGFKFMKKKIPNPNNSKPGVLEDNEKE